MKRYFISDPAYYHDLASFEAYLVKVFETHLPDFVCFRDKINRDIAPYAIRFLEISESYNISRTLINRDVALAKRLGFWGVHLTSTQHAEIAQTASDFYTVVSTHTLDEARLAVDAGADAVTISPIFPSPGKGAAKGVDYLCHFVQELGEVDVFALGGIVSDEDVASIAPCKPYGFASIRYFV